MRYNSVFSRCMRYQSSNAFHRTCDRVSAVNWSGSRDNYMLICFFLCKALFMYLLTPKRCQALTISRDCSYPARTWQIQLLAHSTNAAAQPIHISSTSAAADQEQFVASSPIIYTHAIYTALEEATWNARAAHFAQEGDHAAQSNPGLKQSKVLQQQPQQSIYTSIYTKQHITYSKRKTILPLH